tara:strand:+ start:85 stop:321 length:237 start_codon:yes stop_codon:yes gene_type:complete
MAEEKKPDAPAVEEPVDAHTQMYETANRAARSTIAVIDTITQRGGFKGEELSTIGQLRDQSISIIQMAENFQQEQAQK